MSSEGASMPQNGVLSVENTTVEVIVPSTSSTIIKDALDSGEGSAAENSTSLLPSIQQRQFLFFDEQVQAYVVLRTPQTEEQKLRSGLSKLSITVEGFVSGTVPPARTESANVQPAQPQQAKELLSSETINHVTSPDFITNALSSGRSGPDETFTYVFWKVGLHLRRPPTRLHRPTAYLAATATLRLDDYGRTTAIEDDYLRSHTPMPVNLFQAFASDPELGELQPHLSALRIAKVAPTGHGSRQSSRTLPSSPGRLFNIFPAIYCRIRYSKLRPAAKEVMAVASLELEITPYADRSVSIDEVNVVLQNGEAIPYLGSSVLKLPTTCRPGDLLSLLYKLKPPPDLGSLSRGPSMALTLDSTVKATALLSGECHPALDIRWSTNVDAMLFQQVPSGAYVLSQRPQSQDPAPREKADASLEGLQTANSQEPTSSLGGLAGFGITITISGSPRVYIGEVFNWNLFIVNRSDKARNLAILAVPKRKRVEMKRHHPKASSSSAGASREGQDEDLTEAVVGDNVLYATQKNAVQEPADLVSLSPDIRVGPLAPGACYTTDMKFLALAPGVLHIEALRVVDLATKETSNIRDLPDIVAAERAAAS